MIIFRYSLTVILLLYNIQYVTPLLALFRAAKVSTAIHLYQMEEDNLYQIKEGRISMSGCRFGGNGKWT